MMLGLAQEVLVKVELVGGVNVPRLSAEEGWRAECFLSRKGLFHEWWAMISVTKKDGKRVKRIR